MTQTGLHVFYNKSRARDSKILQEKKVRVYSWASAEVADPNMARHTGDMPGYMRQIGWSASMRYSLLFPTAFMWRHFSNEEFWTALQKVGAVKRNEQPNFCLIEKVMRAFAGAGVSCHGGLFYSGSVLTEYRFGDAAKPAQWKKCRADEDFIAREIMSLKVMWHVAGKLKKSFDNLQKEPSRRLGTASDESVMEASFFDRIDWEATQRGTAPPAFVPGPNCVTERGAF